MPQVFTRRHEFLNYIKEQKRNRNSIGFVPTMGALHAGHAQLIKQSTSENNCTVVSIFVNPKQFGPTEDFAKYPRTFQNDVDLIESMGAQAVFSPTVEEMYPPLFATQVSVTGITEVLCGAYRPGHFNGVTTVVMLLMNLAQADKMYLGQKDFQQVQVIKKMVQDLVHSTSIIMVPTIREQDGLALSSRNRYLSEEARQIASAVPKSLAAAAKLFLQGENNIAKLTKASQQELSKFGLEPQYLEFRKVSDLTIKIDTNIQEETVLAIAQFIESNGSKVRLIDNVILDNNSTNKQSLEDLISRAFS
ncbi:pantoate--beta-alanine ligase [Pigmentibacter sp. JX0631]|uniref:pantoate--beta-alanine ligase n=1 Tax=Pigmentibacter sp. JX0631 TaxID=2976982 RepID=UPI002469BC6A|nr:pantoate--beta-alanine ligase [Pigmentibacter sp. JX0631]WGL59136.1 pantoate--beta-alanine ligase [Pigmentibacter sp. JX0631]